MNRSEILQKLSAGELGVEEAERLLRESHESQTPGSTTEPQESAPQADPKGENVAAMENTQSVDHTATGRPRWLHVHVSDIQSQRQHVRINIPIGIVQAGLRFGSHFGFGLTGDTWQDVMDALGGGQIGTLVDVEDIDKGERVHIFVD
jgi:hypothetical protein